MPGRVVRLLLVSQAVAGPEHGTDPEQPLSAGALARAAELGRLLPRPRAVVSSPADAAIQTAGALGFGVTEDAALRGWDPGAESAEDLLARMRAWLSAAESSQGTRAAVADGAVIRAAVAVALDTPSVFGRLDIAPCSVTELSFREGRWQLAHLNWEPALMHIPQRRGRRRAPTRSTRSQEH